MEGIYIKTPSFKRLFESDFVKEQQELVAQLAISINQGFENVYNALSNRLTFEDNFQATVKDISVVVNLNGTPVPAISFTISTPLQGLPVTGVLVTNVKNLKNPTGYPTSGVTISWTQTNNGVSIDNITGLLPNQTYQLRVIAFN